MTLEQGNIRIIKIIEILILGGILVLFLMMVNNVYGFSESSLEKLQAEADIEATKDNLTNNHRAELIDFINNKTDDGIPIGLENNFSTEFLESFAKDILTECNEKGSNPPYLRC